MTRHVLALAIAATLFHAAPALAQADSPADRLFKSAKEAMARGDLKAACAQLRESEQLDPAAGTLLNLAECEERSSQISLAISHVEEARRLLPAGDFRIAYTDERLTALKARQPSLAISLRGAGEVTLDGVATPLGVERALDPGRHTCIVHATGHRDVSRAFDLALGEKRTEVLDLGPPIEAAPPAPAADRSGPPVQKIIGVSVAGAGVLAVGIGTFLAVRSKSKYDDAVLHCPQGAPGPCDADGAREGRTAHAQASAATAAFIASGVLVAAGAVLYFTAPNAGTIALGPSGVGFARAW